MAHQRFIWADALKGELIMLVVLGHAIQNTLGEACESNHLWNIIYSFHMAAFMAVSGYVAFRPGASGGGNLCYKQYGGGSDSSWFRLFYGQSSRS